MADKQTYWMANRAGEKALITGADERDRWSLHGWSDTDEPGEDFRGFVWMTNPDVGLPASIAWGARDYWMGIGFEPSPPPVPVNPTKDPVLAPAPAKAPAAPAPVNHQPTTTAPAAAKNKE